MRIRTIKPEFFLHEGLFELESKTKLPVRLSFAGLWGVADREGRFKWEPRRIGVQILPYDGIDFSRVLDALVTRGFIRKYCVDSIEYGCIPSFLSHQVINNRERASIIPEWLETNDIDACLTREPRVSHACKEEGKGMERKGKVLSDKSNDMDFAESIYQKYPRKEDRKKGISAILKAMKSNPPEKLLQRTELYAESIAWKERQFIPLPATWFNGSRFNDIEENPNVWKRPVKQDGTSVSQMGLSGISLDAEPVKPQPNTNLASSMGI